MAQVIKRVRNADGSLSFRFMCPGCKESHIFGTGWQFDQNFECPTISPSILVRCMRHVTDKEAIRIFKGEPFTPMPLVCHSFIKAGQIQFLSDCTHALAGQTVPLPPIEGAENA